MESAIPTPPDRCRLLSLPAELLASILSYLTAEDLNRVSETCHALYRHATDDHLWQTLVQENVPGQHLTSPFPCSSFRDLYWAHEPRWFLPRCKIWFSDTGLPGRLIVTRYDQRRGCIEGYQLLAQNRDRSHSSWEPDDTEDETLVCAFEPEIKLHLDNPVLRLPAKPEEDESDDPVVLHMVRRGASEGADDGEGSTLTAQPLHGPRTSQKSAFQTEIPMRKSAHSYLQSSFIHARCLPPSDVAERTGYTFPYGYVWPPPSIPTSHHVLGAGLERPGFLRPQDGAVSRREICPTAFRIRKWLDMRDLDFLGRNESWPAWQALIDHLLSANQPENGGLQPMPLSRTVSVGEEIATYATLDPVLYTPTEEKPFRGIWVGDYGPHGCEFLWVHQPDEEYDTDPDPDTLAPFEGESDEEFAKRKRDATIYRGCLEVIKLTGDPNVPRGEVTFVADDLGEEGFVRVAKEAPFEGVRVVRSRGHVAHNGFVNDSYIDGQLLLISPDKLAHHWIEMGRVSYYHRVDIDRFLVPE